MKYNLDDYSVLFDKWMDLWRSIDPHIHIYPPKSEHDGLRVFLFLLDKYTEPHRHYHVLDHIGDCLDRLNAYVTFAQKHSAPLPADLRPLTLSLWLHDACYEVDPVTSHANEVLSATYLFMEPIKSTGLHGVPWIKDSVSYIEATKHHGNETQFERQLICDIDLLGLGKDEETFDMNSENIRKEYHFVSDEVYATERIKVLTRFLSRPRIYYTYYFYDGYEIQARKNILQEISRLAKIVEESAK